MAGENKTGEKNAVKRVSGADPVPAGRSGPALEPSPFLSLDERVWVFLIIASTAAVLLMTVYCLSHGITIIFMHLFYFPIILLAYRYQYRGFLIATLLALAYVWLVYFFEGGAFDVVIGAWLRFFVFAGVAAVVAYLSEHLSSDKRALEASEKKYRTLFENMLEGFAYCRMIYTETGEPADWVYLDVNAAFGKLTCLANIKGKRVLEAIPDIRQLNPELFDIYVRVAATGKPEAFEVDFKPLKQWLKVSVFSPEKGYFVAVFEDITGRKQAEAVQKEHEKQITEHDRFIQQILETIPNPIFYKDKDGLYTGSNTAFERYIGVSKKNLIGKSVFDIAPKDLADIYYAQDKILLDAAGSQVYEAAVKYADGSLHDVTFNKATLTDTGGTIQGLVGIISDITDRKNVEHALQKSEQQFRGVAERSSDIILLTDITGKSLYVSPSVKRILGYDPEEIVGEMPHSFIHPDDIRLLVETVPRVLEDHTTGEILLRMRKKDGEYAIVEFSATPVIENSKVTGLQVIGRDITERKHAEHELMDTNRRLADIIGFLPDPTMVIDAQGRVTAWNRAMEKLTGIPAGSILGKGDYAYAAWFYGKARPVLIDLVLHNDRDTITRLYPQHRRYDHTVMAEAEMQRPDGTRVDFWLTATPLFDHAGAIVGAIESLHDVTRQKAVARALQESKHYL
ncbi:MAG: PAS domain S-box protein, partial [Methanomicrobiales archaeon]|nr:PAS domain S-box protein [Methanomicrobiales archaeon]